MKHFALLSSLLGAGVAAGQTLNCDLVQYQPQPGLRADVAKDLLRVTWQGEGAQELVAVFGIEKGQPIIRELAARKAGVLLGVAVADKEGNPAQYMRAKGYTYQLLLGGDAAAHAYRATVLPTLYLIDRHGRIAHRQSGADKGTEAELDTLVRGLLGR